MLGRLIEVWTGVPFGDFLQEQVFDPLGMCGPRQSSLIFNSSWSNRSSLPAHFRSDLSAHFSSTTHNRVDTGFQLPEEKRGRLASNYQVPHLTGNFQQVADAVSPQAICRWVCKFVPILLNLHKTLLCGHI